MSFFLVLTRGVTGSFWLANALDLHPDILCTHGMVYVPACDGYYIRDHYNYVGMNWRGRLPSAQEGEILTQRHHVQQRTEDAMFWKRSLDVFLRKLEALGPSKYYGNTHALSYMGYKNLEKKGYAPTLPCKVANLQRHPIKVIESFASICHFVEQVQKHAHIQKRVEAALGTYGLSWNAENVSFIESCNVLCEYFLPMRDPAILHFPIERLTKDRDYFCFALRYLTSGNIDLSREYLEQVFNMGRLNRHNQKTSANRSPEQIFSEWKPWQQDYVSMTFLNYRDVFPLAHDLGYDLETFCIASCPATTHLHVRGGGTKGVQRIPSPRIPDKTNAASAEQINPSIYQQSMEAVQSETQGGASLPPLRGEPIVIHQMGKVASVAIEAALRKQNTGSDIIRTHFLNAESTKPFDLAIADTTLPSPKRQAIMRRVREACLLRLQLEMAKKKGQRLKVITIVREPVARFVAALFHNVETLFSGLLNDSTQEQVKWAIQDYLIEQASLYVHGTCKNDWRTQLAQRILTHADGFFGHEIQAMYDIDVCADPFAPKDHYKMYHSKYADLVVLKFERINEYFAAAMMDLLDIPSLSLDRLNAGSQKPYGQLYQEVLESLSFPQAFLQKCYFEGFARFFYNEQEIAAFMERWLYRKAPALRGQTLNSCRV